MKNKQNKITFNLYHKMETLIMLLTIVSVFHNCSYENESSYYCNPPIPDIISFQNNVLPLIRDNCSLPACHSGGSPTGNLNLEDSLAYTSLSKPGSGYLNLVNPTKSLLYSQMISSSTPMPPTGLLDSCKINLVLKWIQQGAKNN
jgi:hypothetical protein